jgi:DNA-binding MarR family transcriptional regulator
MEISGSALRGELAEELGAALERLVGLIRSLNTAYPMSRTATGTLATLDRGGPSRLTALAAREHVTQPAMTQLIMRLEETRLASREPDPVDGRGVLVSITDEGSALLARRRAERTEQLAALLGGLMPQERALLAAAVPAMNALADSSCQ